MRIRYRTPLACAQPSYPTQAPCSALRACTHTSVPPGHTSIPFHTPPLPLALHCISGACSGAPCLLLTSPNMTSCSFQTIEPQCTTAPAAPTAFAAPHVPRER